MNLNEKNTIESFLDDPDFREWVKGNKPELNDYYNLFIQENPGCKSFHEAVFVIKSLNENYIITPYSVKAKQWETIKQKAYNSQQSKSVSKRILQYAAILLLVISVGSTIYLISDNHEFEKQMNSFPHEMSTETKLFLNENKEIEITARNAEITYNNKGNEVTVSDLGKYKQEKKEAKEELVFNQLSVPYGKKSTIFLADGTKVWLNAGSRLVYPTSFGRKNRTVFLEGEAFFEVAKDEDKPFFIHTPLMKVRVVGTSFVVKAYPGDKTEETIVASGVVSVSYTNKLLGATIELHPNQRAITTTDYTDFEVSEIKIKDYTAWLEDMFIFNDEPMGLVLKRIARYYNLEINWDSLVEVKKLNGKLDLKQDHRKVLETIAITSKTDFYEDNNTFHFKPK